MTETEKPDTLLETPKELEPTNIGEEDPNNFSTEKKAVVRASWTAEMDRMLLISYKKTIIDGFNILHSDGTSKGLKGNGWKYVLERFFSISGHPNNFRNSKGIQLKNRYSTITREYRMYMTQIVEAHNWEQDQATGGYIANPEELSVFFDQNHHLKKWQPVTPHLNLVKPFANLDLVTELVNGKVADMKIDAHLTSLLERPVVFTTEDFENQEDLQSVIRKGKKKKNKTNGSTFMLKNGSNGGNSHGKLFHENADHDENNWEGGKRGALGNFRGAFQQKREVPIDKIVSDSYKQINETILACLKSSKESTPIQEDPLQNAIENIMKLNLSASSIAVLVERLEKSPGMVHMVNFRAKQDQLNLEFLQDVFKDMDICTVEQLNQQQQVHEQPSQQELVQQPNYEEHAQEPNQLQQVQQPNQQQQQQQQQEHVVQQVQQQQDQLEQDQQLQNEQQ